MEGLATATTYKPCEHCAVVLTPLRFCSDDCRFEATKKTCKYCDTVFVPSRPEQLYCDKTCAYWAKKRRQGKDVH